MKKGLFQHKNNNFYTTIISNLSYMLSNRIVCMASALFVITYVYFIYYHYNVLLCVYLRYITSHSIPLLRILLLTCWFWHSSMLVYSFTVTLGKVLDSCSHISCVLAFLRCLYTVPILLLPTWIFEGWFTCTVA